MVKGLQSPNLTCKINTRFSHDLGIGNLKFTFKEINIVRKYDKVTMLVK